MSFNTGGDHKEIKEFPNVWYDLLGGKDGAQGALLDAINAIPNDVDTRLGMSRATQLKMITYYPTFKLLRETILEVSGKMKLSNSGGMAEHFWHGVKELGDIQKSTFHMHSLVIYLLLGAEEYEKYLLLCNPSMAVHRKRNTLAMNALGR